MKYKGREGNLGNVFMFAYVCMILLVLFMSVVMADPIGPGTGNVNITKNETFAGDTTGQLVNISGGYIAGVNITASQQNSRWKAFVGWVNGQLALSDASGDTIYDWSLAVTSGEVYATRTSGTVSWSGVNCSNTSFMETENSNLAHTSVDDNITATFDDTTHSAFTVGSVTINANTCPTLNTYVNNASSAVFEEMVLDDGTNIVFATILEDTIPGFDGTSYDFQMLVPQNATTGSANTPYYIFIEIT